MKAILNRNTQNRKIFTIPLPISKFPCYIPPRSVVGYAGGLTRRDGSCAFVLAQEAERHAGLMQRMVLLRAEKGPGVPVRHWRPERSAGVMVPPNATAALPPAASDGVGSRPMETGNTSDADGDEIFKRHGPFGDAEEPELHGINA